MTRTAFRYGSAVLGAALIIGGRLGADAVEPATRWPAAATVVADGLNNPRGLAWSTDGALLVAEAGVGGMGRCFPGVFTDDEMCFGRTGSVTSVRHGQQRRILTGLPSLAVKDRGSYALGPADVSFVGGRLSVAIGGPGPLLDRSVLFDRVAGRLGTLQSFDELNRATQLADVAASELRDNPDGALAESNVTSLAEANGEVYALDAAGNTLYRMDRERGPVVEHVFGDRTITGTDGVTVQVQSVPTSLSVGPDGALYISELTGAPYPSGAATIWRWDGREMTGFAGGFTGVTDLAFGPDGSLYVLETFAGRVVRVDRNGRRDVVAGPGLTTPTALTVGPTGALYVTNCGSCAGTGTVVRFTV